MRSTADPEFLGIMDTWLQRHAEILVLFRYSRSAGSKDFEFFSSFQRLLLRIRELPPLTSVIAFREKQLLLRGIVDDTFISQCLDSIPDGEEYLVLETVRRDLAGLTWFHHAAGESHAELRDDLEQSRGVSVAVGPYPPWLEDTEDTISAVVPDKHGEVRGGVY